MNTASKEQRVTSTSQLSELLRKRRKTKSFSQAELAAKLGLSQARLSAIESNKAGLTLERLITLANLLDLELIVRDRSRKSPSVEW